MSGVGLADKREMLGMPYRLDRQVDIQPGPIEMIGGRQFDAENLPDRDVTEPWKLGKRQKEFFVVQQNPEAMP
jgi:hypothetical protein